MPTEVVCGLTEQLTRLAIVVDVTGDVQSQGQSEDDGVGGGDGCNIETHTSFFCLPSSEDRFQTRSNDMVVIYISAIAGSS